MKNGVILLLLTATCYLLPARSQTFSDYFIDATLRLDYIFSGDVHGQNIAFDEAWIIDKWYGKTKRLAEVPMEGNGQITVRDHETGTIIYTNSFSTLFQEWLGEPEAETTTKAFENVFLTPMPKNSVDITVELRDAHRRVATAVSHTLDPNDILIRHFPGPVTPYEVLHQGSASETINIAFLAEGYQEQEMDVFIEDCKIALEAFFAHEPYKSMADRFTITAVKSPSIDSGTSEPGKGIWKNTALSSHFDTFYSQRYLTTLHIKDMHNLLAGTPYEHIIVLVNTERYGGGGILNSYNLTSTHHDRYKPVVVHEFGHSFIGLADEYAYEHEDLKLYPRGVEPWEANISRQLSEQKLEEWKVLGATIHEGAGYNQKGIYRPFYDCRMRTNENPDFCPVCLEETKRVINFYTE